MRPLFLLLAFSCGAAYECGCVMWVHYAEKNQIRRAIGWSCFNALVTCIGIESFLKGWPFIVAYVIGYGTGTWLGILIKRRLARPRIDDSEWRRNEREARALWIGTHR